MIHTPVCGLLGIRHPIVLGGMAGSTSVAHERAIDAALDARPPVFSAAWART
jgi:NAD(P)H-dependent flavin oxidoreductase YrpB (nitropropane dioxygenase family)